MPEHEIKSSPKPRTATSCERKPPVTSAVIPPASESRDSEPGQCPIPQGHAKSGDNKTCEIRAPEGKSRNAAATRLTILEAARNRFLIEGYDNAGLRAIAAEAGIDAALICRYFGSKKQLFAEVLESTREASNSIFTGERNTCGQRLAEKMLGSSSKSAQHRIFIGLVSTSIASAEASNLVKQHIERSFVNPFVQWHGGDKAMESAWLMASVLMGLVVMNTIEPDSNKSVIRLAELLQTIIDAD